MGLITRKKLLHTKQSSSHAEHCGLNFIGLWGVFRNTDCLWGYQWRVHALSWGSSRFTGAPLAERGFPLVLTKVDMMQVPSVAGGVTRANWLIWLMALIITLALHSHAYAVTVSSQPSDTSVTEGQSISFRLAATTTTGGSISYSWFKDRTRLSNTSSSLSISKVTASNAGSYSCMVADSASTYVCKSFTLTVNSASPVKITQQPVSWSAVEGTATKVSVTASGSGPISYQWYKNGTALSGATSSSLSISSVTSSNAGNFHVIVKNGISSVTSATATLTVTKPYQAVSITQHPVSKAVMEGSGVSFSVAASGSGTLSYQWYKNGTAISGATSSLLSIASATTSHAGNYYAVVRNSSSSATSNTVSLSVTAFQRVSITQQPVSKSLTVGGATSFAVTATGTGPLSYQWYKNGTAISGATSSTLAFSSATTSNSGNYYVVVRNSGSTATSTTVSLSVTASVTVRISQQPVSVTVAEGGYARLLVKATGTGTLSYQWYKNGSLMSGSTSSSITFSAAKTTSAGKYHVVVKDANSSVTSSVATLTVSASASTTTTPVSITQQPSNQIVNAGTAVTFAVTASGSGTLTYQWYFKGAAISGATARTYSIASAASANAGNYHVVVRNTSSSATSSSVTLSVLAVSNVGSALLSWSRPTTRENGTALAAGEISGYRVYWSNTSTGSMSMLSSPAASATSYRATELTSGVHYFSISVLDANGLESDLSTRRSVTIP